MSVEMVNRATPPTPVQRHPPRETVSVIVTAWDRRGFLREALESVMRAAESPFEIIVVANFSDEGLERIVRESQGMWIVSKDRRLGGMVAEGVRSASGSLISFLDDDDLFHSCRMGEVWRAFEQDANLGFVHTGHVVFRDGESPPFPPMTSASSQVRFPPEVRSRADCERIWTLGAGFNGSSIVVRRAIVVPYLGELREIRKAVPPYLFYRAWQSPFALLIDPRPLTAVRLHATNMTPTRIQRRAARLARLAMIAPDLSADAETILRSLPKDVWSIPLRQMASMGDIFAALNDTRRAPKYVAAAALELLRRRKIWLPRWSLVSLSLLRLATRRGGRAVFDWLLDSAEDGRASGPAGPEEERFSTRVVHGALVKRAFSSGLEWTGSVSPFLSFSLGTVLRELAFPLRPRARSPALELRSDFPRYSDLFRNATHNFAEALAPFQAEIHWRRGRVFNNLFEAVDAELYYSMIRSFKPSRVIEVGAGHSTWFARDAIHANGRGILIAIDPWPRLALPRDCYLRPQAVQDADPALFRSMRQNDVLFIDGSHAEEEARYVTERIYPLLAPGVLIHHHDISFPYAAFASVVRDLGEPSEQSVVLDFLASHNDQFEILTGSAFVGYEDPEIVRRLIPSIGFAARNNQSSLWIRKLRA